MIHEYTPRAPASDGFERGKDAGLGVRWMTAPTTLPHAGPWVDAWERSDIDTALWQPITYRSRGVDVKVLNDFEDAVTVYAHRSLGVEATPYAVDWSILSPRVRVEAPSTILDAGPDGLHWLDLDVDPALDLVEAILAEVAGVLGKSIADVAAVGLFAAGIPAALDAVAKAVTVATKDAAHPLPFREVAATLTELAKRVRDADGATHVEVSEVQE